jgi:WhiB family redox-sensing transcriptional regulator
MLKDCDHEEWLDSGMCLICTAPDSWMYLAACRDADPDTCFPENDEPHLYAVAKRLCEECPVVGFCLEIGLDEKWGVWGGMTPDERHKLSKSPKLPKDRLAKRHFLRVYAYTN